MGKYLLIIDLQKIEVNKNNINIHEIVSSFNIDYIIIMFHFFT